MRAITPRPKPCTNPHKIIVEVEGKEPEVRERYDKDDADFEYQRGVSLVNRNQASCVRWLGPEGRPYKKWG